MCYAEFSISGKSFPHTLTTKFDGDVANSMLYIHTKQENLDVLDVYEYE